MSAQANPFLTGSGKMRLKTECLFKVMMSMHLFCACEFGLCIFLCLCEYSCTFAPQASTMMIFDFTNFCGSSALFGNFLHATFLNSEYHAHASTIIECFITCSCLTHKGMLSTNMLQHINKTFTNLHMHISLHSEYFRCTMSHL